MGSDLNSYKNQGSGSQLKNLFNSLNNFQKISLVLIVVIVGAALFMLVKWSGTPEYAVLYGDLTHEEAAMVVEELSSANFTYKLSDDGTAVMVKKSDLASARLALASEGVPLNSITGFELFDQQFFGLTDFTQQVNYQRALEGELSRTIMEMEEIDSARVHLVLSEDQLFSDESSESSASIVLKIKKGQEIDEQNVSAIKNLTSNAVKSLDLANISIVDSNGNLLTAGGEGTRQLSEYQKIVSSIEREIEGKINNMLIQLLGTGNSIVKVSAELNIDQKESETETYMPGEEGEGVILDSSTVSESYDRRTDDSAAEGTAGVDANVALIEQENGEDIPGYGESEQIDASETNVYQRSEESTQYAVSRRLDRTVYGSGEIKRLNVGVFLNSHVSQNQISDIEPVITAAAGIDQSRGDRLSIKSIDFADMEQQILEEEGLQAEGENKILSLLERIWPAILLSLMLLLLTLRSVGVMSWKKNKNRRRNKVIIKELDKHLGQLSEDQDLNELEDSMPSENEMDKEMNIRNFFSNRDSGLSKDEKRKRIMQIRKKVLSRMDENIYPELKEIISVESGENPQTAAKVIRNWLAEKG